jgi:hypothetical protein
MARRRERSWRCTRNPTAISGTTSCPAASHEVETITSKDAKDFLKLVGKEALLSRDRDAFAERLDDAGIIEVIHDAAALYGAVDKLRRPERGSRPVWPGDRGRDRVLIGDEPRKLPWEYKILMDLTRYNRNNSERAWSG